MNDKPKNIKRNIIIVMCIILIVSVPFLFFADEENIEEQTFIMHDLIFGETDKLLYEMANETEIFDTMEIESPDKRVEIIVELDEQPMNFDASGDSYNSSTLSSLSNSHFDVKNQIATLVTDIESTEEGELYLFEYSNQPTVNFLYDYYIVMNGFSLEIEQQYLEQIQNLPGVKNAYISGIYETVNPLASDDYSMSSGSMMNIYGDEAGKYTGKGTSIAILDSGLETNHSAFNGELTGDNVKHEKNQISNALSNLKADISNVDSVYKNNKIPFAYDYADKDTEVKSNSSQNTNKSHGNHVTGIASGNSDNFKGVAPDSQIVFMKVVSDNTSVATDGTIFAALEDCVVLDVDIINMSLSLAGGFSYATYEPMNDVLSRISNKGISIVSASGNDNNAALANPTGTGLPLAKNPDYSITGSPGSYNESLSVASNINTIKYDENGQPVENANAYKMSNFSSWGVTPDLKLKPEITAPGEGILSSVENNKYGVMNGTSMSSPHIAGGISLIKEYLKEAGFDNSIVNSLIMNTATPLKDENGNFYSPRKQGAGLANINSAIKTKAYVSVNGSSKPKGDLGYNQTGNFDFKFTVHNLSNEKINFNLKPVGLTETTETFDGNEYFSLKTKDYTNNGINFSIPNEVSVEPNSTKEVSINISLDSGFLSMINSNFQNGTFIDGFIILESENNVSLTIPFMGFHGDWNKIPIFDSTAYDLETSGVYETGLYSLSPKNSNGAYPKVSLGKNKVNILKEGNANKVEVEPDRFAIGEKDYGLATQIGLLRNANVLNYSLTNEDGTEIKSYNYKDVRKSSFKLALFGNSYAEYGLSPYPLIIPETLNLEEGKYNYSVKSNFPTENNINIDFQYDKTAPTLENYAYSYNVDKKTKSLVLEVEENHFLGGLQMVGGEESNIPLTGLLIVENPDSDQGDHENNFYTVRINITNLEKYLIANGLPTDEVGIDFYDYVLNGDLYKLNLYKEDLYALCLEAEKIEPFGYTEESFETFKVAFENAKNGLEDISIDEEINTLYEELNLSMESLDDNGTPTTSRPTTATPTDTSETNNATPTDASSANTTSTTSETVSSTNETASSTISSSGLVPTSRTTTTTEKPVTSQTIATVINSNPTIPVVTTTAGTSNTPSPSSSTWPSSSSYRSSPSSSSYRSSPSSSSYRSSSASSSSASKSSSPSSSSASPSISPSPVTSKRPSYPLIKFSDINGEWFETYINNLVSKGSIKGYPDNTFRPNNKITRAEFVTVIVNLFELKLQPKSNRFFDTKTHWASNSIDIAFSNDIIKGVSDSIFEPNREITREEIAVVLSKFLVKIDNQNLNFIDARNISSWSRTFVGKLAYVEIINGYEDNSFRPKNPATRAEAVTMIINTYYSEYAKSNQK